MATPTMLSRPSNVTAPITASNPTTKRRTRPPGKSEPAPLCPERGRPSIAPAAFRCGTITPPGGAIGVLDGGRISARVTYRRVRQPVRQRGAQRFECAEIARRRDRCREGAGRIAGDELGEAERGETARRQPRRDSAAGAGDHRYAHGERVERRHAAAVRKRIERQIEGAIGGEMLGASGLAKERHSIDWHTCACKRAAQ